MPSMYCMIMSPGAAIVDAETITRRPVTGRQFHPILAFY